MVATLRAWFSPPVFPGDLEKTRRAGLLNLLNLAGLAFLAFMTPVLALVGRTSRVVLFIDCLVFGLLLLAQALLRRGAVALVATGMISVVYLWMLAICLAQGTIRNPASAGFLFLVFLAGALFDRRGVLLAVLASSLAIGGLILLQNAGRLPQPDYSVSVVQWITLTTMYILVGGLTYSTYRLVNRTLADLRRENQARLLQRDLAQELAATTALRPALEVCLQRALEAANLDSGGIYVADRLTGDLNLEVWQGLSEGFVQAVAHIPAGSPRWRLVMAGQPVYTIYDQIRTQNLPEITSEGLRAFALAPLIHQGRVVASFNLASHSLEDIPPASRLTIEEIALQVSNALARIMAQEELQRSLEELRRSELRFAAVFRDGHDAISISSLADGAFLDVNAAFCALYELAREQVIGRTAQELELWVHPEQLPEFWEQLQGQRRASNHEIQFRTASGREGFAQVSAVIADIGGQDSILAFTRDITRSKQDQRRILEALAFNETIIDASPIGIIIYQASGPCVSANLAAARIIGANRYNLLYQDFRAIDRWKEDVRYDSAMQALESGQPVSCQVHGFSNAGRELWLNAVFAPVSIGQEPHLLYMFADDTQRQRAEAALLAANDRLEQRVAERTAELNRANQALEKAVRSRDEFLAAMNHELRTPLSGILGLSETLQYGLFGGLSPKQLNAVQNIDRSGRRLLEVVSDVLDYTEIQSGRADLQLEPCALAAICKASLQAVAGQAAAKSQQLTLTIAPEPITILADPARLQQILVNLLSNAVKFTSAQGRIELAAVTRPEAGQLRLTVSDTGIGIPAEDLSRLFQPFVQIDARLARQYEGAGLGLALVKALVERHNGRLEVESVVGQGSAFTVILPLSAGSMG